MAADSIDVICGPTAAGKSAIAMALARSKSIAVISADSRQIYSGFDIGTAKPDARARAEVPHFGIDIADPATRYSAAAWADDARGWIMQARADGRTPVIVGGTGFYIRSLVEPLFRQPELDKNRRAELARYLDTLSTLELRRWCRKLDPSRSAYGRTQLLRAVEIALLTGHRVSDLHRHHARTEGLSARYLIVDPGPRLAGRIEERVHRMVASGWPDEVRSLAEHVPASAPAWNATGYLQLYHAMRGECSIDEAVRRVVIATRQYAKRQRTWLRHQLPAERVTRLDPDAPDAESRLNAWWQERTPAA